MTLEDLQAVLDQLPPVPVLDLDPTITWRFLISLLASSDEVDCVNRAISAIGLPEDFLEFPVAEESGVSLPLWGRGVLVFDVGRDNWFHEMWRCLHPDTLAAVYLTIWIADARLVGIRVNEEDRACIADLPQDRELSQAVSAHLTQEAAFSDDDDISEWFLALDITVVDNKVFPCLSEQMTIYTSVLLDLLEVPLLQDEIACVSAHLIGKASAGDLDVSSLYYDFTPLEDYIENTALPALEEAFGACFGEGHRLGPEDYAAGAAPAQNSLVEGAG